LSKNFIKQFLRLLLVCKYLQPHIDKGLALLYILYINH